MDFEQLIRLNIGLGLILEQMKEDETMSDHRVLVHREVPLEVEATEDGIQICAGDYTLLKITENGVYLYGSVGEDLGFSIDKEGFLKVTRE